MTILALFLLACGPPPPVVEPATAPMSGYLPLEIITDLDVTSVQIAGIDGYDLQAIDDGFRIYTHGAPSDGPAEISLTTTDGETHVFSDIFEFDPPLVDGFERFAALGASLTQGVQGGVPTAHGQLHAPSRVIADLAGVYHPVPLLIPGLFPDIRPADIGPAPECKVPNVPSHLIGAAGEVLLKLNDPVADRIDFALGRVNIDLTLHNVSVGDTNINDLLAGPDPDEFSQQFLAHLAYEPVGELLDKVTTAQIELIEALEPTVVMITDTYGNDVIGAIVPNDDLDPDDVTAFEDVEASLTELLSRLSATGAEVFIANLPRPTILPLTQVRRESAIARGQDPADVDARIAEIASRSRAFDNELQALADTYDNVHVVDLYARIQDIEDNGYVIGETEIALNRFEGMLSTDGVHMSDVGYGTIADEFILRMNQEMGIDIPRPDLATVLANDPHSTAALSADGLPISECD